MDKEGNLLGKHKGYPFYTVGQRKGLEKAFGKPMFVTEIRPETNTVVLGELDDLDRNGMIVGKINLQAFEQLPAEGIQVIAKIRYKDPGSPCQIWQEGDKIRAEFFTMVKAIAPGQSAVFYHEDEVIGGVGLNHHLK